MTKLTRKASQKKPWTLKRSKYTSSFVVMGLGNPGARYEFTRHNVGYQVVDMMMKEPPVFFRRRFLASYSYTALPGCDGNPSLYLIRYAGYMNRSGEILPALRRHLRFSLENLFVVVDNMDLDPGKCRLKRGGGDAGHNGLKSLIHYLGSGDFHRVYIGVGRPYPGSTAREHVLGEFQGADSIAIEHCCARVAAALKQLAFQSLEQVYLEIRSSG